MKKHSYITTTLPYVNASPHIGFAQEIVQADAYARYLRNKKIDVFFNTGTDEHGLKIYENAQLQKKDVQSYVDEMAQGFLHLKEILGLSFDSFIRTTDPDHMEAAQYFWNLCLKSGDIYKKKYKIKYCVGCELEKTDSELADGECPLHPGKKLEVIEEENYFFRLSKYQQKLESHFINNPSFVVPSHYYQEALAFIGKGLHDFSISRLREKMPWGIPVPDDPDQVMYVWFDALINYISCLGWPKKKTKYELFWPGLQFAGKDNIRQQSILWQGMLLSAGLPLTKQIVIHGFVSVDGQKMSKSLGNVISPQELVKMFGIDGTRYLLLSKLHPFHDNDISLESFQKWYVSDLSNGIGNALSRTARLAEGMTIPNNSIYFSETDNIISSYTTLFETFEFQELFSKIWKKIANINEMIDKEQPWKYKGVERQDILKPIITQLLEISVVLDPLMHDTAETIRKNLTGKIKAVKPMFPRF
jgi:methionyl-tRNA synthetase